MPGDRSNRSDAFEEATKEYRTTIEALVLGSRVGVTSRHWGSAARRG